MSDPEIDEGQAEGDDRSAQSETTSPKTARRTAIAVGLAVLALIVILAMARPDDSSGSGVSPVAIGDLAPVTAGPTLDGGSFDLADHRGSWVAVNFFATWCAGCVSEHGDLLAFQRWGQQRGDVELVAVVFQDPPDAVAKFFADRGGDWPVINNPEVPVNYGVLRIPETFIIAPSGQVYYHFAGETTFEDLTAVIESADGSGS